MGIAISFGAEERGVYLPPGVGLERLFDEHRTIVEGWSGQIDDVGVEYGADDYSFETMMVLAAADEKTRRQHRESVQEVLEAENYVERFTAELVPEFNGWNIRVITDSLTEGGLYVDLLRLDRASTNAEIAQRLDGVVLPDQPFLYITSTDKPELFELMNQLPLDDTAIEKASELGYLLLAPACDATSYIADMQALRGDDEFSTDAIMNDFSKGWLQIISGITEIAGRAQQAAAVPINPLCLPRSMGYSHRNFSMEYADVAAAIDRLLYTS